MKQQSVFTKKSNRINYEVSFHYEVPKLQPSGPTSYALTLLSLPFTALHPPPPAPLPSNPLCLGAYGQDRRNGFLVLPPDVYTILLAYDVP